MPEVTPPSSLTSINFDVGAATTGLLTAKNEIYPMELKKGAAITGLMVTAINKTTGAELLTGVTAQRSIDGAAFAALDTAPAHLSGGSWIYGLSPTETGGTVVAVKFSHADMLPITLTFGTAIKVVNDLNNFDPATDTVANVAVCASNTDMRGTDNAATAGALTTLDAKVDSILTGTGTTLPATLATLDGKVDSILTDTGTTLPGTLATLDGKIDVIDANVDSILTDTGTTLPGTLATLDGKADSILTDTGTTLPGTLATLDGKVDAIDTNVDSILTDTGTTLPGTLATLDGKADSILTDTGTTLPGTLATLDGKADSILIDTGTTLPGTLATLDGKADSILTDTGTTLPGALATLDGKVDSILTDLLTLSALEGVTFPANFDSLAIDGSGKVTVDKTGYALSASGLDIITIPTLAGLATTFPGQINAIWRHHYQKVDFTGTQIRHYADDGVTVIATQAASEDETSQVVGAAS